MRRKNTKLAAEKEIREKHRKAYEEWTRVYNNYFEYGIFIREEVVLAMEMVMAADILMINHGYNV